MTLCIAPLKWFAWKRIFKLKFVKGNTFATFETLVIQCQTIPLLTWNFNIQHLWIIPHSRVLDVQRYRQIGGFDTLVPNIITEHFLLKIAKRYEIEKVFLSLRNRCHPGPIFLRFAILVQHYFCVAGPTRNQPEHSAHLYEFRNLEIFFCVV